MKKKIMFTVMITLTILLFIQCTHQSKVSTITGKLHGFNTKSILLVKSGGDFRFDATEIPVVDSAFHYDTIVDYPEGYNIFLGDILTKGSGKYTPFILEPGTIEINIYPEKDFDKNSVKGGKLNHEYTSVNQQIKEKYYSQFNSISVKMDSLYNIHDYFSDTVQYLYDQLNQSESQADKIKIYQKIDHLRQEGNYFSPSCKKLNQTMDSLRYDMIHWQQDYIAEHPDVVSYFLLYNSLLTDKNLLNMDKVTQEYQILSKKFPDHPYTADIKDILESINRIKVGGKYIDFTAPDMEGNNFTLSDQISGKIALLDLWGSWCGPCILVSRAMVPVYEDFKDKGFTVIGVAGEYKNTDGLKKRLEKEQFPWLNLVELDKQHHIWLKYGCPNSGGETLLIDKDGTILAINPDADKVREILNEKLKT